MEEAGDVPAAIVGLREKVEHGAIVPDVHGLEPPVARDVSGDPRDSRRGLSETRLRATEGGVGDVEYGQTVETTRHECIDQARVSTADVQHAGAGREPRRLHHLERNRRQGFEPTDVLLSLGRVDALPVLVTVHVVDGSADPGTRVGPPWPNAAG